MAITLKSISSDIVGPKLLTLFGINKELVKRFTIVCSVGKPVEIIVEYIGELDESKNECESIIKEFVLIEKDL